MPISFSVLCVNSYEIANIMVTCWNCNDMIMLCLTWLLQSWFSAPCKASFEIEGIEKRKHVDIKKGDGTTQKYGMRFGFARVSFGSAGWNGCMSYRSILILCAGCMRCRCVLIHCGGLFVSAISMGLVRL